MKVIVYKRPDGGISIVNPAPNFIAKFASEDKALVAVQAKSVPLDAVDIEVVEQTTIPIDRWFRNAWTRPGGGGSIKIDMPKAREVQASKIQNARQGEIDRLRSEEDRARLASKNTKANKHASDRAALETMNLTAVAVSIAGAANPTALKAIWPAGLPLQA